MNILAQHSSDILLGLLLAVAFFGIRYILAQLDLIRKGVNDALHEIVKVQAEQGERLAKQEERSARAPWDIDRRKNT